MNFIHGHAKQGGGKSPEYHAWQDMKTRCNRKSGKYYKYYGGRNIRVCDEWMHDFQSFLSHMGFRPSEKHTVDRIDNNGNYEPGNCRWATRAEQSKNIRSNVLVPFKGKMMILSDVARIVGIKPNTFGYRIRNGWPIARAVSEPLRKHRKKARGE